MQLFRAGKLVQDAFYESRERHFNNNITSMVKKGDKMFIVDGPYEENSPIYFAFPDKLFKEDRDKKAMLSWLSCNDSVVHMLDITLMGLDGKAVYCVRRTSKDTALTMSAGIDCGKAEYRVRIRPELGRFDSGGLNQFDQPMPHTIHSHHLVWIKLRDGTQYALDVTGAQYGQMTPVMLYSDYAEEFMEDYQYREELGFQKQYLPASMRDDYHESDTTTLPVILELQEVNKDFDQSLREWCKISSVSVRDFLRGSQAHYDKYSRELLDYLREKTLAGVARRGKSVKLGHAAMGVEQVTAPAEVTNTNESRMAEHAEAKVTAANKKPQRVQAQGDDVAKKMAKGMMKLAALDLL